MISLKSKIFGILAPLEPVWRAWMIIVHAFSWLLVRIVSFGMFCTAFTIYGIVMRIIRFDPLNRRFNEDKDTYWEEPDHDIKNIADFKKQF